MPARRCLRQVCALALLGASAALRPSQASAYRQVLDNHHDMSYFGNMTVGGQRMQGVYDTGSVELVVVSDKCSKWCGQLSALFHSVRSASYQNGPQSVVLQYGSGEVLGHEAYDSISVGPLHSAEAPFWEVVDANMPLLQSAGFTSIVGLGPITFGTGVMQPHAQGNKESYALLLRKLEVDRFSVCLGRPANSPGFLVWNDDSVQSMPRAFAKMSTVPSGFWMTSLTDVRLGSTPVACAKVGMCGAVLDSGTSLISMPSESRDTIIDLMRSLDINCDSLAGLPELHFKLDGVDHSLPPDSYIGRVRGSSSHHVQEYFRSKGSAGASCQATLMQMSMNSPAGEVWVLGMPFFRRYYSVFSQATATSPAVMHTALADADCRPTQGISQALQRNVHGQRAAIVARNVDAAQVRVPSWLRTAASTGYLDSRSWNRTQAGDVSELAAHAQAW